MGYRDTLCTGSLSGWRYREGHVGTGHLMVGGARLDGRNAAFAKEQRSPTTPTGCVNRVVRGGMKREAQR